MPAPQHVLAIGIGLGRRPGHIRQHGFLHSLFATSPWLGGIAVAALISAGLVLTILKKAGRVLEGTPWYVRLALLGTAILGIIRLMNKNKPGSAARPDPGAAAADWPRADR